MLNFKRLINNIIKSLINLLMFILLTGLILKLLNQNFGFQWIEGKEYTKNIHLIVAALSSVGILFIVNILLSKIMLNLYPTGSDLNPSKGRNRRIDDYDFIDDMQNNFVDDIPKKMIVELPNDFIDEVPKKEKLNQYGSLTKKKIMKKTSSPQVQTLAQALMLYKSGGIYRGSRPLKVKVTKKGLYYGIYFIPKENIISFDLDVQTQGDNDKENLPSFLKIFLLGPLSLLLNQEGMGSLVGTSDQLIVNHVENKENFSLILEGDSASKIYESMRQMNNNFK